MKTSKKTSRLRRAIKTRAKIRELGKHRLTVHRTPRHIYAQILAPKGDRVLVQASTLDEAVKTKTKQKSGNVAAAKIVGELIAKRAREAGIDDVAFDRAGFRYHGRIQALADAARESGMTF